MKQPQEKIPIYDILLNEDPHLTTLKAKFNACANKLNRNRENPGTVSDMEEEELFKKLHVIKQLILACES